MLSARFLREHRSIPDPAWLAFGGGLLDLHERLAGTEVIVEGIERLPGHPVLLATNASHKYDVLPFRCAMRRRAIPVVSVAKGKYFRQHPPAGRTHRGPFRRPLVRRRRTARGVPPLRSPA